jgi:hypothetical protein
MLKILLPLVAVACLSLPALASAQEPTMEWYAVSRTPEQTDEAIRNWSGWSGNRVAPQAGRADLARIQPLRRAVRGAGGVLRLPGRVLPGRRFGRGC